MRRRWGRTDNVGHGCGGETTTTEGGEGSPGFEYLNPSLFDDGRDTLDVTRLDRDLIW